MDKKKIYILFADEGSEVKNKQQLNPHLWVHFYSICFTRKMMWIFDTFHSPTYMKLTKVLSVYNALTTNVNAPMRDCYCLSVTFLH